MKKEEQRKRIGRKIKQLREEFNMTQDELEEKTGIRRTNISRIEQGKYNIGYDTLQAIAEVFGKQIDIV